MGPKRHGHFRSPLTGVDLIVLPVKAASERERAMSEGRACVAGSAIVARRESRSAMPERLKVAARRQLRRRMGSRRGCGRFRRGGQRCGGQWCRWRHESWSRDGALHRVTLLRPGGARRPAQEPGREDLGEAVAGSTPTCPPVARRTAKRCLGASARPSGRRTCSSSPRTTSTTLASRYERRAVERQRARWHDPALRATPVAWAHAQAASTLPEGSPKSDCKRKQ
jgi:hypothetical protein